MSGIVSYGVAIPRCRIAAQEILNVWKNTHMHILERMGYQERAVLYPDQDSVTLAIDACLQAVERSGIPATEIDALVFGSGTNPYQTKASATIIAEALGLRKDIVSFDLQFSGKSGTTAMIAAKALVDSGQARYALAIGSDTINRHIPPGHQLEYGASAAAVATLIGTQKVIANIVGSVSYAQDQADYFRVEGERYIQVGSGMIGYVSSWGVQHNVVPAGKKLFEKLGITSEDLNACALHQHSFVVPMLISGPLKLNVREHVLPYILTPYIGDCGAASSLIPLAYILDEGETDRKILLASYGSGAGSDCIYIETTSELAQFPNEEDAVIDLFEDKIMLDYGTAQKYEYKYIRGNLISGAL